MCGLSIYLNHRHNIIKGVFAMGTFEPWHLLLIIYMVVFIVVLVVWPFWRIFDKAGYPGIMSLLMIIPIFNVIALFFLAFAQWPALKRDIR